MRQQVLSALLAFLVVFCTGIFSLPVVQGQEFKLRYKLTDSPRQGEQPGGGEQKPLVEVTSVAFSPDGASGPNLGLMYKRGRGVTKDQSQAIAWFRKAAENGSVVAMTNLGDTYRDAKDYTAALKAYYDAAVKKDAGAQRMMGIMAYNGEGCTKDYAVALKWFRLAADQGNADAQNWLGIMYGRGHGVTRDTAEAARWYRKAAAQGLELAKKNLEALEQNR